MITMLVGLGAISVLGCVATVSALVHDRPRPHAYRYNYDSRQPR